MSNIVGTARADVLNGTSGDDTIDGLAGNDTMYGGQGNDTYIKNDLYDRPVELANEGDDTVIWTLSAKGIQYSIGLWDNIENLTVIGNERFFLNGNSLANRLIGGEGSDFLRGREGADTMIGGLGDDAYYVENQNDVVTELANEGNDTVRTSLSIYTLGDNIENLHHIDTTQYENYGTSNFTGTGNDLANLITGGLRGDRLDGGAGADTLVGLLGNDTYVVDNAGDVVIEQAGEGIDRVLAQASYTLGDNVETLQLTTSAGLSGTGNDIANLIIGNKAANVLDGRGGADTLTGGAGADTFVFRAGETVNDTVTDFVRGTDKLTFYGFGTDAVLSHGAGSDLYTVTSGDGLTSGSFRLTGVGDLDVSMGAGNTDARFFA